MDEIKQNITAFLERIAKHYPAVELRVRVGDSSELVDQYPLNACNADVILGDMRVNAQGVTDPVSSFFLRALGNGDAKGPSRSFSIVNDQPTHQADRFEANDKATNRMLLEHTHRSHIVITNTMSQMTEALQGIMRSQTGLQAQMAETHSDAIAVLREAKADQAKAEVHMLETANKAERTNKLLDAGMALLPSILDSLKKPEEGGQ